MDHHEEEQVEALTRWLKKNGPGVLTGIALGLAVVLTWNVWNRYQAGQQEHASALFEAVKQAAASRDLGELQVRSEALLDAHGDSTYAHLARLTLAKASLESDDLDAAIAYLEQIIDGNDAELRDIARLRLARILIGQGRLDEAELQLNSVSNLSFTAEQDELRGDLFLARDEPERARDAYQAALAALGESANRTLVEMKLDSLPAAAREAS